MAIKTVLRLGMAWGLCLGTVAGAADERLWLKAEINEKPARLCFDSGAEDLVLFREAAQRLGLIVLEPPTNAPPGPGEVLAGLTEECSLKLMGETHTTRFRVVDIPAYMNSDLDGVVGWRNVEHSVLKIDAVSGKVTFLTKVPKGASSWSRFAIVPDSDLLALEVPRTNADAVRVYVDTGTELGVLLPPAPWQAWKAAQPPGAMTLKAFYTPADGIVVVEEGWAPHFSIGPLFFTGVPVAQAPPSDVAVGSAQYGGTLGLAALKRLEFIVDGGQGAAYVHPRSTPPPPYRQNRLGAVFVPRDAQSEQLVARVMGHSAAQEAGIRTGDILLKVGTTEVSRAHHQALRRFESPAGTRLELTLMREGRVFKTTATLRQVLPPPKASEPR